MALKIPFLGPIEDKLVYSYSLARTLHFTVQQASLPIFEYLTTGQTKQRPKEYTDKLKAILPDLLTLLQEDAENIKQGYYPWEVLKPENPARHLLRFPQIIIDGYSISKRRETKNHQDFSEDVKGSIEELPEYYQRNFHFQTDGYLSDKSAELYEHQVEILFAGAADAMRRLLIKPLKERYANQGEGLHFLEVAAGTGRLTRFVKLAFPKARVTVLDLSDSYLKKAQQNLSQFDRLNFVQGAAEALPFPDQHFDAVISCFLFHELPREVREQVIKEGHRVLKGGGLYGLVDSIQAQDAEKYQWALDQFPVDFHEPFYKNYILHPMEDMLQAVGFLDVSSSRGFFSKAVYGLKGELGQ